MNFKKASLALAIVGSATMGFNQEANAGVYAASSLAIQNLAINIAGTTSATINTFTFTTTNSANLNGATASGGTMDVSCGGSVGSNNCGSSPVLDATVANAPGGSALLGENTFALLGPGNNSYAVADSVITTAELVNFVPTSTNQTAQSELQTTGAARSSAEIQSNTGFSLAFTISGTGSISLSFEADPYLRAYISQIGFLNGSAQANINTSFTLTQDQSGEQVRWTPNGTVASDCTSSIVGVSCVETADAIDLNANATVSSNPADNELSAAAVFGAFGFSATGLSDGNYTLALNANTSTNTRLTTVPEPNIVALLGMGLLGLGFSSRKEA